MLICWDHEQGSFEHNWNKGLEHDKGLFVSLAMFKTHSWWTFNLKKLLKMYHLKMRQVADANLKIAYELLF